VAAYGYLSDEDDPDRWEPTGVVSDPLELLAWMHGTSARAAGDRP
jgi:hypothetical protein